MKMAEQPKLSLPKPEFIEGEIDYPEMIKKDFRKAMLILTLSVITALVVSTGVWALFQFLILA
jgi:hypothetical protein